MFDKLPNLIDPIYSAQHNKQFVARVNQQKFPRLVEQLVTADNDVNVNIQFYMHPQHKLAAFDMEIHSILKLKCQRSLKVFDYPVETNVTGVFVETLALADDLPDYLEIYELGDEKISLIELIEDEVLLNVPLSPIDESSEMAYTNPPEMDESASEDIEKKNPFAALKGLQKDPD